PDGRLLPDPDPSVSVADNGQHDFQQNQEDDDQLQELRAMRAGLVGDDLVDPLSHFQLALDARLPLLQVQARRQKSVNTRQVLVADQLEPVAGPLEQVDGLDLQLAQHAQRLVVGAPEAQPAVPRLVDQPVGPGQVGVESFVDVAILQQLHVGQLDHL